MPEALDDAHVSEIEDHAIKLAHGAGLILIGQFGTTIEVEFKDDRRSDPVSAVDKECQSFLAAGIADAYPDHGFLGEEGEAQEGQIAPDIVWVVDPLDGTKNYVSGIPVFACSIGVLYRGAPIVGATFVPWPGEPHGVVMHARRGAGAFLEQAPVMVFEGAEPEGGKLVTLPASFGGLFRLRKPLRGKVGDPRITGSISYEQVLTARGALQYSVAGFPRLWDVAAGAILVTEAGGFVMVGKRTSRLSGLLAPRIRWEPLGSFVPSWRSGTTTLEELRTWSAPLVLGSPPIVRYVTSNLRARSSLRRRLGRASRRLFGRRRRT